jgi:hypothetical protein
MPIPFRLIDTEYSVRPSAEDRLDIQDLICAVTMYADLGNYDRAKAQFAERATMHYASLFGEERRSVPAAEFLDYVQTYMPGFDATQHQVTNFEIKVQGDYAESRSQVRASHRIGSEDWVVASIYLHTFTRTPRGWRISAMGVRKIFEEGERSLLERAAARLTDQARDAVVRV